MFSVRFRAQLALLSAAVVLVTNFAILIQGREGLRSRHVAAAPTVQTVEIDKQLVFGGPANTFSP